MDKRTARQIGRLRGYELAIELEFDPRSLDDYDSLEEAFLNEAFEAELISRSYSPWEFVAYELNNSRYPDEVWAEYERGVEIGIRKAWNERRKDLERLVAK